VKKIIIGVVVGLVVVAFVVANLVGKREKAVRVETEFVTKRNLKAIVSASGQIQPRKSVDVSANTIGQIIELAVAEGDSVEKGQLLVRIDPRGPRSTKAQAEAALRAAKANLELYKANLEEAKADLDRTRELYEKGLASEQQMISAKTAYDGAMANVAAARSEVARQEAALASADYELSKVTIRAEMSGVVTRLNVEEGENVIMGTMNNPGTVLMTISDLSHMEAEVLVDETDVVDVEVGQDAEVKIDAFPDTVFGAAREARPFGLGGHRHCGTRQRPRHSDTGSHDKVHPEEQARGGARRREARLRGGGEWRARFGGHGRRDCRRERRGG